MIEVKRITLHQTECLKFDLKLREKKCTHLDDDPVNAVVPGRNQRYLKNRNPVCVRGGGGCTYVCVCAYGDDVTKPGSAFNWSDIFCFGNIVSGNFCSSL